MQSPSLKVILSQDKPTFIANPIKPNKILLIMPPAFTFKAGRDISPLPPIGIGLLAAALEQNGYEVKILDCLVRGWENEEPSSVKEIVRVGLSDEDIKEFISEFKPDMVGVSCMFSVQHKVYPQIFSLIKSVNPQIITLAGGAHATVCPDQVLEDPNCDFVIIGEAEKSIIDFFEVLNGEKSFEQVDGLSWKKSSAEKVFNPKTHWIEDLDDIPFPAYHIIELERYFGIEVTHGKRSEREFVPIVTSRGCPAKCTFCSANKMFGYKSRLRSVQNIIDELKFLKKEYGIKEIMFEDDNITATRKHAVGLFSQMIEEQLDLKWDTPNGVGLWALNTDIIDLMKKAGCVRLNFPIESADQEVLKNIIKKPVDLCKVKNLLTHCQKIGLEYGMFLVVGMPGEKVGDIWTSFKFAADTGCYHPFVSIATPYPGTELFEICKEQDYFSREYSLDNLFNSSFLISTSELSETKLRRVLLQGKIYLKAREIFDQPMQGLTTIFNWIKHPLKALHYIRRIFRSGSLGRY